MLELSRLAPQDLSSCLLLAQARRCGRDTLCAKYFWQHGTFTTQVTTAAVCIILRLHTTVIEFEAHRRSMPFATPRAKTNP